MDVLFTAWAAIKRNAETSGSAKSRQEVLEFGGELPKRLKSIQGRLSRPEYRFNPQRAVLVSKGKGKAGKRGLIVASLEDRIVQRAILDVLHDAVELHQVQEVLATPTSIGGIRGRGVDDAICLIDRHIQCGMSFIAGSDIAQFFTRIPRPRVVDFIATVTDDADFVRLFDAALGVEIQNVASLDHAERKLFPTGADGVAQGCPLSALAGNIVLREFDAAMNGRGIVCVRYIDDFVLLGAELKQVRKAMESAGQMLNALGMSIYDPASHPAKAFIGCVDEGHTFLGYRIVPGLYPPSDAACKKIIDRVAAELNAGKKAMRAAVGGKPILKPKQCCAQTLTAIDSIVRGWAGAFSFTQCTETLARLDGEIDSLIGRFLADYRGIREKASPLDRRRALGVRLLQDRRAASA